MKKTLLLLIVLLPFISLAQAPNDTVDIPDPNFKYALLHPQEIGDTYPVNPVIDTNNDGEIEYSEAQAITHLNLFNGMLGGGTPGDITDLNGIEAFTNLTYLDVSYNHLGTLNLSGNAALDTLYCYHSQLTDLDVQNNPDLKLLWCQKNYIQELDVAQNLNLKELDAEDNQLTQINLIGNPDLEILNCSNNYLDSLSIEENPNVQGIDIKHNNLAYLNLRNENNTNVYYMNAKENSNLTCIYVDDKNYSENAPNWQKDTTAHYVETETECETFGVADFPFQTLDVYPNPVKNKLHIKAKQPLDNIQLFNLQGKRIRLKTLDKPQAILDFSNLPQGIYFLKISTNQQSLTQKIIKL